MAKSWLVDGRAIARKVKTCSLDPSVHQIKDFGANCECPQCHCRIDNSNVFVEWPGLPVGVKFDPSDVELLEHLAAKYGVGNENPHQFIDKFIPTLDVKEGICYKHPENLPGARKDGKSVHFFYRTTNAYTTGQRKRRKIHNGSNVRWHKTGKTKAILKNGVQIGCKKIMVLHGAAVGGSKPIKTNWVMHQYHLGNEKDEKEGQYVVSKIFYQPQKQARKSDNGVVVEDLDAWMSRTSPRTPKTNAPAPPRYEDDTNDYSHILQSPAQESKAFEKKRPPSFCNTELEDNVKLPDQKDDSEAVDFDAFVNTLLRQENLNVYSGASFGTTDLENLDMGTPPDFNLAELYFSSQDSVFGWMD